MIHRIAGVFLIIAALIVGVHTVIEPLYHTTPTDYKTTGVSPYSASVDLDQLRHRFGGTDGNFIRSLPQARREA